MDKNRRRFIRKVPGDPAFIQIERDEVGKVLNVSEGGLSFRSVTPVPKILPVYFWFSFNLKDRIEAMGEVAWTDLSRTVGGLRFTQISQAGREQIQKWLSRLRTEEAPREVPEEIEAFEEKEIPEEEEALIPQLVTAGAATPLRANGPRSEEHTSELQSPDHLVCRLLLEKKKKKNNKQLENKSIETNGRALKRKTRQTH